jgi:hypothetical protein
VVAEVLTGVLTNRVLDAGDVGRVQRHGLESVSGVRMRTYTSWPYRKWRPASPSDEAVGGQLGLMYPSMIPMTSSAA